MPLDEKPCWWPEKSAEFVGTRLVHFFLDIPVVHGYLVVKTAEVTMYLRVTGRKKKDGSKVEYVQLAHNKRHPETGTPQAEILYNFGRRERVDEDGLRRLVRSITRFLGAEDELKAQAREAHGDKVRFVESRPMGSAWLLRGLWKMLGVERQLKTLAKGRRFGKADEVEGAVFSMVANRALEPLSKHATPEWLEKSVSVPEAPGDLYDERLYRAMYFLLKCDEKVQKAVFFSTADLLNLEVDLLLYDTTSTYFEMEYDDVERQERQAKWDAYDRGEGPEPTRPRPQVVNDPPCRLDGYSRDRRPDRPQVVVGLAVTKDGIPVRCWTFAGNTADAETVATVKKSLKGWKLNRVVWAVDRGMVSEDNLKELQKGGAHYIAGEKMRSGSQAVKEAMSRAGRYKEVRDNLQVKEIVVGVGERRKRYILVRNPAQQERDRQERERQLKRLEEALARLPKEKDEHTKAICRLVVHPTLGRYLKTNRWGRLKIDREKVKMEENLDGKYLVVTSDDSLSPEDVALGYKQLLEVERAWRTLKSELDMRPMYHRKRDRIEAHVLLCWLALLLVRVVEVRTGYTWPRVRQEMDRLHRGVFECASGRFVQRTELTQLQHQLLKAVEVPPPPRFEAIQPASPSRTASAA